jgi:hypothetical protein
MATKKSAPKAKSVAKKQPKAADASVTLITHAFLAARPQSTLDDVLAELKKRNLESSAQVRNSFRAFKTAFSALQQAGRIKG